MTPVLYERDRRCVRPDGRSSQLTPIECRILALLMAHEGSPLSSEQIYATVWQAEPFDCRPLISVHIRHIRKKIEQDPSHPDHLKMKRGCGYCFCKA